MTPATDKLGKFLLACPFLLAIVALCATTASVPLLGVFAVLAIAVGAVGLWSPRWLLAAAFFLIPFDKMAVLAPADSAGFGNVTFLATLTVTKLLFLGLIAVLFLRTVLLRSDAPLQLLREPMLWLAVGFVGLSFASLFNAGNTGFFALAMSRRISLLILLALVLLLVRTPRDLVLLLTLLAGSFGVVAVMGVYEAVTHELVLPMLGIPVVEVAYLYAGEGFRPIAAYGDPNTLAINMAVAGMIGITLALYRRRTAWTVGAIVLLLLVAWVILATASRGGMLAFVLGLSAFLLVLRTRARMAVVCTVPVVVLGLLALATDTSSQLAIARLTGQVGTESIQYRLGWMSMALQMTADHPILGVGTSQFLALYEQYAVDTVPRSPYYPHNSFLQVLAENGIAGFLAFAGLYLLAFANVVRAAWQATDPRHRCLAVGLLAVLIALATFAATSNTVEMELYWIVFAFSAVLFRGLRPEPAW